MTLSRQRRDEVVSMIRAALGIFRRAGEFQMYPTHRGVMFHAPIS
jgi:hypothetical protein